MLGAVPSPRDTMMSKIVQELKDSEIERSTQINKQQVKISPGKCSDSGRHRVQWEREEGQLPSTVGWETVELARKGIGLVNI